MNNYSFLYEEHPLVVTSTEEIYEIIDVFIGCFFINIITPIGVIGNIISIIVLYRHDITQDCSNILLISLAVSDLLYLITVPIRYCKCLVLLLTDTPTAMTAEAFVSAYVIMPSRMLLITSISLVTVVALQRFIAVFFPLNIRYLFTPYGMKLTCVSIYLLSFMSTFVYSLCLTHNWFYDETLNDTLAVLAPTTFFIDNYNIITWYSSFFLNIFVGGFSLLLIFASSASIALKIASVSKKRKQLTQNDTGAIDLRVVKMLLSICLLCFCVFAPTTINDVYVYFIPNIPESSFYRASKSVSEGLFVMHSSCNFVIYVTLSTKFSAALKLMFKCRSSPKWNCC